MDVPSVDVAAERRLVRLQAWSGLVFGVFLLLHLANTAAGAFGTDVYDGVQRALRVVYQNPLVEVVCVGVAALVHAACGASLALRALGPSPPIAFGLRELSLAKGCAAVALALGVVAVLTLGGAVGGEADTSRDDEWKGIYGDWAPFMVNWDA